LRVDIFCKVVDNYGDIGVCWRLAQQLSNEHQIDIRLWIDELHTATKIIPQLDVSLASQLINNIKICHWPEPLPESEIPDVVIEAFACELPESYQKAMQAKKPLWINLEYLSAERWVDEYHAQSSIHPRLGLKKYFYFPGFSPLSGGLIREQALTEQRQSFQTSEQAQADFWKNLAVEQNEKLKVSLFCYPHAPVHSLLDSMSDSIKPVHLLVPEGIASEAIKAYFAVAQMSVGDIFASNQLTVQIIPFLSQSEYDKLLWACDLNFVRGEDSWIRALWSAQPFIWQPYQQEENTHFTKLEAFLDRYASDNLILQQAHHAWLGTGSTHALWDTICYEIDVLKQHARTQTEYFENEPDLAAKLVIFCKNHL